MKASRVWGAVCASTLIIISIQSKAALISVLDGQAYYDDIADLTWLVNANAAGTMSWADANTWVAGLNINGVTGWRLPDTLQPDSSCSVQFSGVSSGLNCAGSEMGNMFYNVLGGTAGQSIILSHNSNYDLFSNIQPDIYWSGLEFDTLTAWYFAFNGFQHVDFKGLTYYAWAVHSGNADAAAVPVPAAVWLFGSGLLGLIGIAKRKNIA